MPYEPNKPSNRDYAQLALNMSIFGTAMALILVASRLDLILDLSDPALVMNMLAVGFMSFRRGIDDWVREIALESAGFAVMVMSGLALVANAARDELAELAPGIGVFEWPFMAGLLVFYATFHVKRWRGA